MRYYVITPEYEVVVPVLDFGEGPTEPCRDVVEVEAENKRQAKVLGVKLLRQLPRGWMNYYRDREQSPFTGVRVESVTHP